MFMSTNNTPCKYFQQNNCTRGDQCQFRHDPLPSNPPRLCSYFLRGSCQYGTNCHNNHNASQSATNVHGSPTRCTFYLSNTCTKGSSCMFLHDVLIDGTPPHTIKESTGKGPSSPFGPCKFFSKGYCMKGTTCPFPHEVRKPASGVGNTLSVGNHELRNKLQPVRAMSMPVQACGDEVSKTLTTERHLLGSRVVFGPGASIEQVTTAFESCFVNLSNIPVSLPHADLILLLETFGHLKTVKPSSTTTMLVEFETIREADRAVAELNLTNIQSCQLVAQLALRRCESGAAVLRSSKVKLSWYAPSLVAWAHFSTISLAREAQRRLDGQRFSDRKITVTFQTPSRHQTESFSVEIKGLPAWVKAEDLRKFCRSSSITLGEPSYGKKAAAIRLRQILGTFGHLDAFDLLPAGKQDTKIKAFAQFSTAEAAGNAFKALHNEPQEFLRRGPLFMEIVHSVKYNIAARHFEIVRADIDNLCSQLDKCKIRYYHRDDDGCLVDPVCVRVYSTDSKSLSQAKANLEAHLGGQVFTSEGIDVWDDYFDTKEAKSFFEAVYEECRAYVNCDRRKRRLKLLGQHSHVASAQEKILKKITEIRSQRHVLPLELPLLRRLMVEGLAELERTLEGTVLSLDVVARTLTVHGGNEIIQKAQRAMAGLVHSTIAANLPTAADCPVCFCQAEDSIKLSCGHSYCTSCLKHFLKSAPDTKTFPLRCVASQCTANIPLSIIRDLMSPNEEENVLETSFLSFVQKQPEVYRYCPTPDCQILYRPGPQGTALRCPDCLIRICPSCHVEFHEGLTCKEYHDNTSGLEAYRDWRLANNVKACPKCKSDIEKNGGCNHITCARCRTHICWVCMEMFSDDDGSGGVYAHMRREHGGINER